MVGVGRTPPMLGPQRGDVHFVTFPDSGGHVLRGPHPAVVVQSDRLSRSGTVVLVPMTSSARSAELQPPYLVAVPARESGLPRDGFVKCDQPVTLPVALLGPRGGRLNPEAIDRVDAALRFVLALQTDSMPRPPQDAGATRVGHLPGQGHLQGMEQELATPGGLAARTVAQAAAGDAAAFAVIVAEHHDDMARVCFVICGNQDAAQDAVQTAWSIAWRKLSSLREPDHLRPWLVTIAANEARQTIRRRRRHNVVEIEVADVGSDEADPAGQVGRTDLAVALRRLSDEDRSLLALRHVAGFDATEIGRAMGISPSGVRSRLMRAASRLRSELGDD